MEQFGTSSASAPSMLSLKKKNLKRGRMMQSGDSDDMVESSPDMSKIG